MPPKETAQTRAKHWCLTVFADDEKEWFKRVEMQCKYWAFQEEVCPETGREHLQAYIGFEAQTRFNTLKRLFPTAHLEMARSAPEAFDYCLKPDTRKPGGFTGRSVARPSNSSDGSVVGGGGKKREVDRCADFFAEGGDLASGKRMFIGIYADNPGALMRIFEQFSPLVRQPDPEFKPDVVILFGPPGTGKTSAAKLMFGERKFFRLTIGKWADGYEYESGILFDDMEPNLVPRAQLLVLMETGYCTWEIKGGVTKINVQQVIITSNYDPLEWFPRSADGKDKEKMHARGMAVVRRAKVYEVTADGIGIRSEGNTSPSDLAMVKKNQTSILDLWKS